MLGSFFLGLFYVDRLSIIMISLVSFIGIIVSSFSKNYMQGDSNSYKFYFKMLVMLLSVILMVAADNILLFLTTWLSFNFIVTQLIVHKESWKAAQASGQLAFKNFAHGFICIVLACILLYNQVGSFSIQYIINHADNSLSTFIALILLLVGIMRQSAILPFHRWLISSLNSPTPVSALMHAGIINGGGFLLVRFSHLYCMFPWMLDLIFVIGLITAVCGCVWKLMQHDVKRMLACSTMSQMGFMFMQCGLGFFASAIAHLFWHGLFKAYMFLASGSAAQEKRFDIGCEMNWISFLLSLICGVCGSYIFVLLHNQTLLPINTNLIVVAVVFIASSQVSFTILAGAPFKNLPVASILTACLSCFYAANIYLFDLILAPLELMHPQPLNVIHIIAFVIFVFAWISILFFKKIHNTYSSADWALNLYVRMLNSCQPHPATVTTYRKGYDYE